MICYRCQCELTRPGALLLSPQTEKWRLRGGKIQEEQTVSLYHLCFHCWKAIMKAMKKGRR